MDVAEVARPARAPPRGVRMPTRSARPRRRAARTRSPTGNSWPIAWRHLARIDRLRRSATASSKPHWGRLLVCIVLLPLPRRWALTARLGPPPPLREVESGECERVLHDVCSMLRVGHSGQLIGVLAQVVGVATTIPELERRIWARRTHIRGVLQTMRRSSETDLRET